ncbi:polysaccharide deacetylase family protein [Aquisalibacillus elongatus]|uniref:Peptidoglycan/xylan/chitin deacetylase (PgdA/CDA1 family) n=1 Tax=Aquisalibacillus elongatus TaxID=485577 RepID=A0A3N5C3G1_9BACI|nr:polysaccharide deacetylase family protein [Aquisalibacillus elongatus]RPF53982.1 peptidoglycan/xylan/chitin deacetylase (PgdA/CDA1 family) [Aquisalibacillus elongatus]
MSYTFKLLELVELNQGYAKIRLTIDQNEKLIWFELDDQTYQSLKDHTTSLEGSLWRLSFTSKRDPFTDTYTSTLTAVDGSFQRKVDFVCSKSYQTQLEEIKGTENFKQVEQLSFIHLPEDFAQSINDQPDTVPEPEEEPQQKKTSDESQTSNWASFKVDDVVEEKPESDWLNQVKFPKIFRNGLLAGVALAVLLAFSSEHFAAFENENSEPVANQDDETLVLDAHSEDEESDEVEERSVSENSTEEKDDPFPMYEVESNHFYSLPEGYVALTFDDGPSVFTKDIAGVLADYGVAGTFFFVGQHVEKYPEAAAFAEDLGHVIGSHSHSHDNLNQLTPKLLQNDMLEALTGLEGLVGRQVELFRPPFGAINQDVQEVIQQHDLKTVMWNRDPRDWKANNETDIINYFKSVDPSGGIYILHENKHTLNALPEILDYLESQGLQVVGIK